MNLTDYKNLESTAAKNGAITVDAADLLAWREEREELRSTLDEMIETMNSESALLEQAAAVVAEIATLRMELADHEALQKNCSQYHSEVERLRQVKLWAWRVYPALVVIDTIGTIRAGGWSTRELVDSAPDEVRS